jgi:hypothetical protein
MSKKGKESSNTMKKRLKMDLNKIKEGEVSEEESEHYNEDIAQI